MSSRPLGEGNFGVRLDIAAALLAGVALLTLAACNDQSDSDVTEQPPPVEVEFDFDSKTKTKIIPPPTLPTYQPPRVTTTKRVTPTRATRATR